MLRFLTAGESHGGMLIVIVDGLPAGLPVDAGALTRDLRRRQRGYGIPAAVLLTLPWFLGGFDTGWTGYPPLSFLAPLGMDMFFLGVYFVGLSSIFGSLNIIATIVRMRAPGMNYFRMPIFVWTAFATAIIGLTATQLIGLSFQMVLFERVFGMAFFEPAQGGNPILFQHLFWFYSHPALYVFVLTGLGVISELLPVFARKPLFGYRWVALSSFGIALVGFLVWAHHMFTSGMEPYLRVPFMYSTLLVAVPTGIKFFSWVGTNWEGKLSFETPMLFVLGAISIFLLGGLSGPPNGVVATDLHVQDTYWIVGHLHATLFGGFLPILCRPVLLVSKDYRQDVQRAAGKAALLADAPCFLRAIAGPDADWLARHAPPDRGFRPVFRDPDHPVVGHYRRFRHRHRRADRHHQLHRQRPQG